MSFYLTTSTKYFFVFSDHLEVVTSLFASNQYVVFALLVPNLSLQACNMLLTTCKQAGWNYQICYKAVLP